MTHLALTLALLLAPIPTGCAHDKQALRTEDKEKADLSARSELFWRSLRWQDVDGAATFIEDDEQRRSWKMVMETEAQAVRWMDASLLDLSLGPVNEDPDANRLRQATVRVRTESYTLPAQVLRRDVVSQTWYRSRDGWFLDWQGGDPVAGQ